MHLPKAILFDLDGTLTDTLADLAAATNEALQKNGSPVYPLDAYRHMVGSGARVLIRRALGEKAEETAVDRVLADFLLIYDRDCLKCTAPYEGIPAVIDWFAGHFRKRLAQRCIIAFIEKVPSRPHHLPIVPMIMLSGSLRQQ